MNTPKLNTVVTDSDRRRFPYHTDSSIIYRRFIAEQKSEDLKARVSYESDGSLDYSNPDFEMLVANFQQNVNRSWVMARIGDELYERQVWGMQSTSASRKSCDHNLNACQKGITFMQKIGSSFVQM